jgi:N-acetylmuramoyl-L-alanine amidase
MRSMSILMPARLFSSSACRRGVFQAVVAMAFALPGSPAVATSRHTTRTGHATLTAFARAEQLRDALESRPEQTRTRSEYERVLDAYRSVYHSNPADPKAPEAVNMVAGLLAEEGRIFHRDTTLLSAVGQFEFLRTQYPASPYQAPALLAEATIFLHDLHDPAAARAAYVKFLNSYPRHPMAAQARAGLNEIEYQRQRRDPAEASESETAEDNNADDPSPAVRLSKSGPLGATAVQGAISHTVVEDGPADTVPNVNKLTHTQTSPEATPQATSPQVAVQPGSSITVPTANAAAGQPVLTGAVSAAAQNHHGRLPVVTNVRHWSTPVYTRVAIDLQDQVQYEAARVPHPDRIYFDLHGARVAPELIGRTVDVTDDGFLERIRVAQFSNDVTRIVLDVNQVTEYSAFFLPNPWRLIIDIHGRDSHGTPPGNEPQQQVASAQAAATAPEPNVRQTEPVATSNQSSKQATRALRDIAAVSARPDQVKATSRPTTEPIVANVKPVPSGASSEETPAVTASVQTPSNPLPSSTTRSPSGALAGGRSNATSHRAAANEEAADENDEFPVPGIASHEASSTLEGQRSLTRALGLKIGRIVVDAGHGGHDSGTLGPGGIEEKEVVLDVALRLGKLLRKRMGADVIYTRNDDTFIPLEERTAIANKSQADLFISVHANSSSDPTARGVETYYLNFTTSPDALEVAARENAVSDESIHELSGLVKKITLKDKIDESREFAADVNASLYAGLERGNAGLRDRGVKKAPFVVLIGANMPSILAEISFLTNPDDAAQLRDPEYRERIAESLYRGVAKYVNGLSGLRIAQNSSRNTGN